MKDIIIKRENKLFRIIKYIKLLGILKGVYLIASLKIKSKKTSIKLPNLIHPIIIRNGSSDVRAFEQIFIYHDYEVDIKFTPRLIIDCGANVGYASIYFANLFPNATIISVEPEESNFQQLTNNVKYYKNIKPIKSAIWSSESFLKVEDIGKDFWGMVVKESDDKDPGSFKATTISRILQDTGYSEIDILKMDIEGAEKEVFIDEYKNWIDKVKLMFVELHDRLNPGASSTFNKAINGYPFLKESKGENIILHKINGSN